MSVFSLIRTLGLTVISERSHYSTLPPFRRLFEPYQHAWNSIGVEDESMYVLSYVQQEWPFN